MSWHVKHVYKLRNKLQQLVFSRAKPTAANIAKSIAQCGRVWGIPQA